MKVIVKARHMNLTPALKAHAEEKLGASLSKIFDRPAAKIEIELTELGSQDPEKSMECRVTVFMPKARTITISEFSDEMYKAIDLAHDRLLQTVKRERDKRRSNSSRARKEAERGRQETARKSLTAPTEEWESEVKEYEQSTARV